MFPFFAQHEPFNACWTAANLIFAIKLSLWHLSFFAHKIKMEVSSEACTKCGRSPCLVANVGNKLIDKGWRLKQKNSLQNKQVRFRLHRRFAHLIYGVLGLGNRVPPPKCIEQIIKDNFPNEDGAAFVGHKPRSHGRDSSGLWHQFWALLSIRKNAHGHIWMLSFVRK